ncbi:uncharacterized protein Nmlp_3200 [Natronomonas moolapensis 8.8.11]|uniref:Flagella cluster protein n=1 Tax=Natronomonas moolapensis (strain DSM 18674 / CECT 7526 / JCM 14361 / 8.8.11) TaxID=268739 RepID=M1XSI4_NATM8|nr:hypothetical protein [Natronomonas moolapensis]CCQ37337.1 uncharacterized protein Nmlp_3200 [Natronomonas moolapensis 8.8.11]
MPDDPDPDSDDDARIDPPTGGDAEEGKVLSPEELDLSDSEYVEELDDSGRYVVSPGGGPPNVPDSATGGDDGSEGTRRDPEPRGHGPERPRSPETARTLLAEELSRSNARYGLDIVASFEGDTARHRTVSDDVISTFEGLVRWYASHVTDGTPPDEVVDILLRESTFETAETPNLAKLLSAHDLDRTDTIEELVVAIREEAGGR